MKNLNYDLRPGYSNVAFQHDGETISIDGPYSTNDAEVAAFLDARFADAVQRVEHKPSHPKDSK